MNDVSPVAPADAMDALALTFGVALTVHSLLEKQDWRIRLSATLISGSLTMMFCAIARDIACTRRQVDSMHVMVHDIYHGYLVALNA